MAFTANAAWVNRILGANWDRLKRRVGQELLPVEVETSSPKRRRVTEYGCGHYGCVSPTATPNLVFKVTSDPLEAHFVAAALSLKTFPDGIVRYMGILQLDGQYRNRPVFAVWREEAHDIGLLASYHVPAKDDLHQDAQDHYERRTREEFKNRLTRFKLLAGEVKAILDRARDPAGARDEMGRYKKSAWDRVSLDDVDGRAYWHTSAVTGRVLPFSSIKGAQRAAFLLRGCEIIAEQMANEPGGYMVGQALEFYLEHGLLLADVHLNNIGRVSEPDRDGFVITDPGHAVPLDARFAAVAIDAV